MGTTPRSSVLSPWAVAAGGRERPEAVEVGRAQRGGPRGAEAAGLAIEGGGEGGGGKRGRCLVGDVGVDVALLIFFAAGGFSSEGHGGLPPFHAAQLPSLASAARTAAAYLRPSGGTSWRAERTSDSRASASASCLARRRRDRGVVCRR